MNYPCHHLDQVYISQSYCILQPRIIVQALAPYLDLKPIRTKRLFRKKDGFYLTGLEFVDTGVLDKSLLLLNKGLLINGIPIYTIDSNCGKPDCTFITLTKNKLLLLISGMFRPYLNSINKNVSTMIFLL